MKYQLYINATIRQVEEDGRSYSSDQLTVSETVQLGTVSFLEMTAVLGQLHKLVRKMQLKQEAGR